MYLIRKAFQRLHYPVDAIAQCVRWYLAYALSLRNPHDTKGQYQHPQSEGLPPAEQFYLLAA